ncbi:MAG TPA: DUF2911 domain-containing protein [Gemmatimonadaceae bacterium]|nr:DUF2911 domain-containing protein [Gemmatimonadaceae bacterium]
MIRATCASTAILLAIGASQLSAQGSDTTRRMAASSFATVEVHVNERPIGRRWYAEDASLSGPARIAISYGQPHARGRKIEGGLIPNDTVWRFGSNYATTLHTEVDLTLGSLAIPRGDYTLFLLHSGGAWQLIVNSGTAQWGTDRNASKDFGRVALTATAMNDNEETLTIYLVPDSPQPSSGYATLGGVMRVRWGTVQLTVPWSVR